MLKTEEKQNSTISYASSSEGYMGKLLCCSFLQLRTGAIHTLSIRFGERNDRRLLREVGTELAKYSYHIGHNIPESRGGTLHWDNLIPICCRCNLSMGSQFTIYDFNRIVSG